MTPLEQLLPPCRTVHRHLRHHVAGDVACPAPTFTPVEAIGILVPKHLEAKTRCLRRPVQLAPCAPGSEPHSAARGTAGERSIFGGPWNRK